jgi:hypothetical protein
MVNTKLVQEGILQFLGVENGFRVTSSVADELIGVSIQTILSERITIRLIITN